MIMTDDQPLFCLTSRAQGDHTKLDARIIDDTNAFCLQYRLATHSSLHEAPWEDFGYNWYLLALPSRKRGADTYGISPAPSRH